MDAYALFPSEVWDRLHENVYVARSRRPRNKTQAEVFAKELIMAQILAEHGHIVYLLPEYSGVLNKHPDALVDGVLTEFKRITGDVGMVSKRFRDAKKQGDDVFLNIDSVLPMPVVYSKLRGEVMFHRYAGCTIYVYLDGTLYTWDTDKML